MKTTAKQRKPRRASSCTSALPCSEHWAVHVYVSGKCLLSIGHNHLCGVGDIMRHAETIRNAANHLLGFIGEAQNDRLHRPLEVGNNEKG